MVICKLKKCLSIFMIMVSLSNSFGAQLTWGSEKFDDEESVTHVTSSSSKSIEKEEQANSSWGIFRCVQSAWRWCKGGVDYKNNDDSDMETRSSASSDEGDDEGSSRTDFQNARQNTNAAPLSWEDWYFSEINAFWDRSEGWYNRLGTGLALINSFLKTMLLYGGLSDKSEIIINSIAIGCDAGNVFFHSMENYADARNAQPYVIGQRTLFRTTLEDEEKTCCMKCFECHDCCIRVSDSWVNAIGAAAAAAGGFCTTITTVSSLSPLAIHIFQSGAVACAGLSCACHLLGSYIKVKKTACGNCYHCLINPNENDNDPQIEEVNGAISADAKAV